MTAQALPAARRTVGPMTYRVNLYHGDCLTVLRILPDNSVDSIVTDPPYGLTQGKKGGSGPASVNLSSPQGRSRVTTGFMGLAWDADVPSVEIWQECLRVLKPGGHLLAFAGTRTQHRMATRIEDAGFEIRDVIMWVYGSGMPKSHNVSKALDKAAGATRAVVGQRDVGPDMRGDNYGRAGGERMIADVTAPATPEAQQWDGWGTALKPAVEPITLARKPLCGTVAQNVLEHGPGALNIDGCRVGNRWPANLIHDGSDEVLALFPAQAGAASPVKGTEPSDKTKNAYGEYGKVPGAFHGDEGSAARFFYCPKASRADRNEGVGGSSAPAVRMHATMREREDADWDARNGNPHPTVKPTDLMRYLVRLVTPPGGVVLDPFMGSGSTGKAAVLEGFGFTGVDLDASYVQVAEGRISHALDRHRAEQPALFAGD